MNFGHKFGEISAKNVDEILLNFDFRAVRRNANLVDLEKKYDINTPTLAIRSVDTAEIEPYKVSSTWGGPERQCQGYSRERTVSKW